MIPGELINELQRFIPSFEFFHLLWNSFHFSSFGSLRLNGLFLYLNLFFKEKKFRWILRVLFLIFLFVISRLLYRLIVGL